MFLDHIYEEKIRTNPCVDLQSHTSCVTFFLSLLNFPALFCFYTDSLYKSHYIVIFSKLPLIKQKKQVRVSMEKNIRRYDVWRSLKDGEYQEDDVWAVLDGYHQPSLMISNHTSDPSLLAQSFLSSEPRMIQERQSIEGMAHVGQHSVPVNVPEWSMVHRMKTKKVDDDDENVSPEEYFLRRSRSSSSSSVMEGVGRKLKGRDLSKVRNAVLKKTGFLE